MDVCVTVPMNLWTEWIEEGDLPGEHWSGNSSHFWLRLPLPAIKVGERVYIGAHNRLRGYSPLVALESRCAIRPSVGCLMRYAGAVAVTIPAPIRGFRGFRYRWWERSDEILFPEWRTP